MFNIFVDYPKPDEEIRIMKLASSDYAADLAVALTGEQIIQLQQIVRRVPVAEHVYTYTRDLVRATRPNQPEAPDFIRELVTWGAGPRASIYLILAGKARAILNGRFHVTTDDIRSLALPVLRHRVITTFNAEAQGITADQVIRKLVEAVPVPNEQRLATA